MPVRMGGKRAEFLSLPRDIRAQLESVELPRLARLREAIGAAAKAKVPMPPIHVTPWGWKVPGVNVCVFGRAIPLPVGDCLQWGVELPVSTPLILTDDDLLRRIICHESAHCWWWMARLLSAHEEGRHKIDDGWAESAGEALFQQAAVDGDHLIDPWQWFGEQDARSFIGDYDNTELDEPAKRFHDWWLKGGMPVRKFDPRMSVLDRIGIPTETIAHIRSLQQADNAAQGQTALPTPEEP
jgi:hypothetical protein